MLSKSPTWQIQSLTFHNAAVGVAVFWGGGCSATSSSLYEQHWQQQQQQSQHTY